MKQPASGGLFHLRYLERFQAKWVPVRVKKTRQKKTIEPRSDSIGTEKALVSSTGEAPMPLWTCEQCGAQFPDGEKPPAACLICEDERQFVNWTGQRWLAREELTKGHKLVWRDDLGIPGIGVEPSFAIGQRALLIVELDGCVMWDCVPLATSDAVEHIKSLGGLKAIAVSHPHFYGAVADWSEAFGGAPVYLHGDHRK